MMPLPKEPSGKTRKSAWFKMLWRAVRGNRIIAGDNIVAEHKPEGTVLHAKGKSVSAGEGGGVSFKGEWSHSASYSVDDIVYLPQGYAPGNPPVVLEPYNLQSYVNTGTWIALMANSGVTPGTDATKWERFAFGPVDEFRVTDSTSGLGSYLLLTVAAGNPQYAIGGDTNPADGSYSVAIGKDYLSKLWFVRLYSPISGGHVSFSADQFTGTMTARTVYVADNGVLKTMYVLGTEPAVVSV